MIDLEFVTWFRACLDDDERSARKATPGPWRYNPRKQWHGPPPAFGIPAPPEEFVAVGTLDNPECVAVTGPADHPQSMCDAFYVAEHDPVAVLADIAAKRLVIAHWEAWQTTLTGTPDGWTAEGCAVYRLAMSWTVRLLAQAYAGRTGWREEWRQDPVVAVPEVRW